MSDQTTPENFVNPTVITVQFEIHTPRAKPQTVQRVFCQFFLKYLSEYTIVVEHLEGFSYKVTAPNDAVIWFHIGGAVRQIELSYQ